MLSLPTRRGPRTALLLAASAGALLATSQTASAADFCVGVSAGCSGSAYAFTPAGLTAALAAAGATPDADRVILAQGTISSTTGFAHSAPSPIELRGAGHDQTLITWSGAVSTGLNLGGVGKHAIHDLGLTIGNVSSPQPRGLSMSGESTASHVDVRETSAVDNAVVVILGSGAQLVDSAVVANSQGDTSVMMSSGASEVRDSTIDAGTGSAIRMSGLAPHLVARTRITNSWSAVEADSGPVTVRDSVIDLGTIKNARGIFGGNYNNSQSGITLTSLRNTIVGTGAAQKGITAYADSSPENTAGTVTDTALSLTGVGSADLSCVQAGAGVASLASVSSAYAVVTHVGSCTPTSAGRIDTATTPIGFVDRAAGDLRPTATSPLVDAGTSSADAAGLDLLGTPRLIDGNADGIAKVDIGAFEHLPPAPADAGPKPGDQPAEVQPQAHGETVEPGADEPTPTPTPQATPIPTPAPTNGPVVPAPAPKVAIETAATRASKRGRTGFSVIGKATRRAFALRLSNATSVELTLALRSKGQLIAGNGPAECIKGRGTPRCTLTTALPTRTVLASGSGPTLIVAFGGRLGGRTVKAGTYRVTVTPLRGTVRGQVATTTITVA